MSKIHSLTGGITLQVRHIDSDGYALINVRDLPKPTGNGYCSESAARYPVADLAAALGLVTREDFDRLLEAREKANAALRAELDEAKATIARVRELAERWRTPELLAALDPMPAFVLPTEAGAGITAHAVDWTTTRIEFRLFSDGLWHAQNGKGYVPDQIMTRFTNHRLIGAES